jgi:4-amino-4-deoxy-L-arabinose transferase-like glycosyltransferase
MKKNSSRIFLVLCFLVILLASFLRFWKLSSLPAVVHRDEAAIAYNAYSILKTGKDEHGESFPINFLSFGDYKLPGLIYASIPFIKVFGLNLFSTRLMTAIFALLTLPAVYFLIRNLGWKKEVSFLGMFILAFDFWHVSQARNAYEPIVGLFFSVSIWVSFLAAEKSKKYYLLSLFLYVLGSAFYNLPFLLVPFLLFGTWIINNYSKFKLKKAWEIKGFYFICFLFLSTFILTIFYSAVNVGKAGTTILSNKNILELANDMTFSSLVSGFPSILTRLMNHSLVFSFFKFLQGYFSAFDPSYLFFLGGRNAWHNLRNINLGDSNPMLIFSFLFGIYYLLGNLDRKKSQLVIFYLVLSPFISALTIDSPNTNRLLDFHLAMILLSSIGIYQFYEQAFYKENKFYKHIFVIWIFLYFGFFSIFFNRYFFSYNKLLVDSWNPGINKLVIKTNELEDDYDSIFITTDISIPYIYFAFYSLFDPADFQKRAQWYKNGFEQVGEYGKYHFSNFPDYKNLNLSNVDKIFDEEDQLILVIRKGKVSDKENPFWIQKDWKGEEIYYALEFSLDDAILNLEKMPSSLDRQKTLEYLYSCQFSSCIEILD